MLHTSASPRRATTSADIVPSSATNRLGTLRQSLVEDAQHFHDIMEKRTIALREQMNAVRMQLVALDQRVSYEAKNRVKADEDIARSLDEKMEAVDRGFMKFINQHCQRIEGSASELQASIDNAIEDTTRSRGAQDAQLKTVRDDHRNAVAELHKALDATKVSSIEFESKFASDMGRQCGQLEDRITLNLSIQNRVSMELVTDVRTALSKRTKEDDQHEANLGVVMLDLKQIQKQLESCAAKRSDAFAAFTETMDSMVLEVNDAVKKMNMSRGSDHLSPRRK
jgi:hypothetical protein